jgi:hypothetical protein
MYNQTRMTCRADGNPPPRYQWLQKLPSHEVILRGEGPLLLIDNVTYDQQGEYVCKAINEIRGEPRAIQSEPIILEVTGAPQISRFAAPQQVTVQDGEDAVLEVRFCADPLPEQVSIQLIFFFEGGGGVSDPLYLSSFSALHFFLIILFGSTNLLTEMTGISLHMQWPLTSQ